MHSARWRSVISLALLTGCAGSAAVQANEHLPVRNVVLYWHFLDVVWIVVFACLLAGS